MALTGIMKLAKLRSLMKNVPAKAQTGIQAYLVTIQDAHQSEYICDRDKRIQYISGFRGSEATVLVTQDNALLWTDGRYFLQAVAEFDPPDAWTLMKDGVPGTPSVEAWISQNLPANSTVGVDPNLIKNTVWNKVQTGISAFGQNLIPIENNLIDEIWGDERPPEILNNIAPHKMIYSGKPAGDKVMDCLEEMEKNKATALVLTALDEVAYLLNWRGSDIPYNPVFFAYVVLMSEKVHLFFNDGRLSLDAKQQLTDEKVDYSIHPYGDIRSFLKKLSSSDNNKVWLSDTCSYALHSDCSSGSTHVAVTPVCLMKLVKNNAEIEGMKLAHLRDGVALVKYFSWLEHKLTDAADKSIITEISGADQLEKFRMEQEHYVGPSFDTISAAGKHGAIVHYEPSAETDARITNQEMYLCDAGAQFLFGTTDTTRTWHFGQPSCFEKECFTRVFKGQATLSMTKFPSLIKGNYLDTLARKTLWDVGLDYLHGTGHGVGAYLNVHEFPTMISWRPYPDDPGMQPGMFLSNEPGYYEDDHFGIRLENVEMTVETKTKYRRRDRVFLGFETVTLVPIQTKLLDMSMLTEMEVQYLNDYHKRVYESLKPHLQGPNDVVALRWLEKETQPIKK